MAHGLGAIELRIFVAAPFRLDEAISVENERFCGRKKEPEMLRAGHEQRLECFEVEWKRRGDELWIFVGQINALRLAENFRQRVDGARFERATAKPEKEQDGG